MMAAASVTGGTLLSRLSIHAFHRSFSSTVPVTVLSGFLGAGKTTMLNHILHDDEHKKRIAVIVNDMAEINIDGDLVGGATGAMRMDEDEEDLVELSNGCICCTLREDLIEEVAALASKGTVDHIVVESTGVSEPLPVAQTFSSSFVSSIQLENKNSEKALAPLDTVAHLHCLTTVVDCSNFLTMLKSIEDLKTLGMSTSPDDARPLGGLLVDQCQFANIVLLNKTDLASEEDIQVIEGLVKEINPAAIIRRTEHSKIDVKDFLDTPLYDEEDYNSLPAWAEEMETEHRSETEEYGIYNFSYQKLGRPLHPERWHDIIEDPDIFNGVLRGKGCFWLATQPNDRIDFSLTGSTLTIIKNTVWVEIGIRLMRDSKFSFRNSRRMERDGADEDQIKKRVLHQMAKHAINLQEKGLWDEKTKDRRVELVFIGDTNMDKERISKAIDDALLTDEEMETFFSGKKIVEKDPFAKIPSCISL